jgi:hypothetical protein
MRRIRPARPALIAAAAALSLLAAACGGGGSGDAESTTTAIPSTSSSSTTTTSTPDGGARDEYVAAFAEFFGSDAPPGVTEADIACAAEGMVDAIGVDRLVELGITPDDLANATDFSDFDEQPTLDEARAIVDAIYECIDIAAVFAGFIAAELQGALGGGEPEADLLDCFGSALGDEATLRDFLARSLLGEEVDEAEFQQQFLPAFLDCIDWASFIVGLLNAQLDEPLSADTIACIEEEIGDGAAINDAILAALENDGSTIDSVVTDEIGERVAACLTEEELAALGGA